MKCAEFAKIAHDLARSREPNEAEATIARAHAEICPACGCLLAEAEGLAAILRDAGARSRSLGAPPRVEMEIMAAFRAARAAGASRRWKPAWRFALGWAGAATVLSLMVFAWLVRAPGRPASSAAGRAPASPAITAAVRKPPAPQTAVARANPAGPQDENLASGFVPVPFAGGFARGDSGVIVRVQVPRSALAELGYPVDEAQGEGMVQADLLVGEDGWPHAVRIVK